jgi:VCBS repeat-containing protein
VLLANDGDVDAGDTKTFTAVGNSAAGALVKLAGGDVVYDPGALFQTLKAGATTTDTFAYTMADSAGAASSAMVTMTISGTNDAPAIANPIADQSAVAGSTFNFSFAADTFFDIDAGDTVSYAAALGDGAPLPSWLSFDAVTRTFTGTPPGGSGAAASALQLRVDATDTAGASASDLFALNIAGSSSGGSSGAGDDDAHDSHQDDGGRGQHGDWNNDDRHKSDGHDSDRRDLDRHDDARHEDDRHEDGHGADKAQCHDARDVIAKRLEESPHYDFTALASYVEQQQGGFRALTPAQVAGQWRSVQERVGQLAQDDEDSRHGAHGGEHYGGDAGLANGATLGGYAGATGQGRGVGGMSTFGGLDEGFRKLG